MLFVKGKKESGESDDSDMWAWRGGWTELQSRRHTIHATRLWTRGQEIWGEVGDGGVRKIRADGRKIDESRDCTRRVRNKRRAELLVYRSKIDRALLCRKQSSRAQRLTLKLFRKKDQALGSQLVSGFVVPGRFLLLSVSVAVAPVVAESSAVVRAYCVDSPRLGG